jgi:sugar lactone lactonase YvrE
VVWFPAINKAVIAMAGIHQLWAFDPVEKTVEVLAGTTNEGMVDGDANAAWFAQTSGLAVSSDGNTLWLADSETSSLRRLTNGVVHTEIGKGLFDFGHIDGDAANALLQHPLGIAVLPDDSIVIADTYNKAVRHFDPVTKQVTTVLRDLAEPSGFTTVEVDGRQQLVVVESAAHQLTRIQIADKHQVRGDAFRTQRPATLVKPGKASVRVVFTPPTGQKLDDRYGPSTHLVVSSTPPELLIHGTGSGPELSRNIEIADLREQGISQGVLHVSVRAASCDIAEENEFPACHVHQQDWGVPVTLSDDGLSDVALMLAGLA